MDVIELIFAADAVRVLQEADDPFDRELRSLVLLTRTVIVDKRPGEIVPYAVIAHTALPYAVPKRRCVDDASLRLRDDELVIPREFVLRGKDVLAETTIPDRFVYQIVLNVRFPPYRRRAFPRGLVEFL